MPRFAMVFLFLQVLSPVALSAGAGQSVKIDPRVTQRQGEIRRLQRSVSQQESVSRQAAERLAQQDRTIVQLKGQLKAARHEAKQPVAGHE